jgi:hypothetical protein
MPAEVEGEFFHSSKVIRNAPCTRLRRSHLYQSSDITQVGRMRRKFSKQASDEARGATKRKPWSARGPGGPLNMSCSCIPAL